MITGILADVKQPARMTETIGSFHHANMLKMVFWNLNQLNMVSVLRQLDVGSRCPIQRRDQKRSLASATR